jgi:hypothetical protein
MTPSSPVPDRRAARRERWAWRFLVIEAAAWLTVSVLALRLLPFRHVARLLIGQPRPADTPLPAPASPLTSPMPRQAALAVTRASTLLPFPCVCLPQAMAAKALLARRGHDTVLHLSVSGGGETGMAAHAWLTLGGSSVIGGGAPAGQVEIARLS